MSKAITILLLAVGVINFLPVLGVLSAERLSQAYGIATPGSDLEILLRHRALLFGIVGGFVLFSLFAPLYQGAAMVMAGVSMVGFLFFLFQVGGYNEALHRVMIVDVVGIACLAVAAVLKYVVSS
ncbi:MAG: hypothetical protein R3228_03960 [Halioglobus sp.]|nr:hypothetical protein [Halioglobus sp.]